jgi:hypothetical protein
LVVDEVSRAFNEIVAMNEAEMKSLEEQSKKQRKKELTDSYIDYAKNAVSAVSGIFDQTQTLVFGLALGYEGQNVGVSR